MLIKELKDGCIRTARMSDGARYIELFKSNNFNCSGMNADQLPSTSEERGFFSGVVNKKIIDEQILVIEINNQFIGYATISRNNRDSYHIGQFVMEEDFRGKGYSQTLLDTIKQLAVNDESSIRLECLYGDNNFFVKQGFKPTTIFGYLWENDSTISKNNLPKIFMDWDEIERIEKIREEKEYEEELKRFSENCKRFDLDKLDNIRY